MGISFHCEYCGKKIQAPDTAAGKKGKCPACHNQIFVPAAETADDELKLAPINESEVEREKRLLAEWERFLDAPQRLADRQTFTNARELIFQQAEKLETAIMNKTPYVHYRLSVR